MNLAGILASVTYWSVTCPMQSGLRGTVGCPLDVDTGRSPASLAGHGKAFCFHRRSGAVANLDGAALIPRTFDVLLSAPAFAHARLAQLRICSGRFR